MKVLFVWPNKDSFGFKPIGISLLASIACRRGWETKLLDTTEIDFGYLDRRDMGLHARLFKPTDLSRYGHIKKKIDLTQRVENILSAFQPDCVAVSVLSEEFLIAKEISNIVKKVQPSIPLIWGGKYPTLRPEKALQESSVDFVCIGEGFDAFEDFLAALEGKRDRYSIPNIYAKKEGGIKKNVIRPLKKGLDDLPYIDWDIFDPRQFYKPFDGRVFLSGDHMLNWGCPYHCTYCINHFYHTLYDNKYYMRRYSIDRIIEELKFLKEKYSLAFFKFHDEDFLMRSVENLHELSDAYRAEVNIPFVIETNPKSVTKEKVSLLKNMNCVSASIAIEAGDPTVRKDLLKRVDTEEDVVRAFSLFTDYGIRTSAFNLLGIPFDSRESYHKTVALNRHAHVQYPIIGFFYPFDGTELRDIAIKNNFFNPDDTETVVYRRDIPALHLDTLSSQEIIAMRDVFVLYVKLPPEFEPFIRRSEKNDALGVALRKKLVTIYEKTVWKNDGWYIDDGTTASYLTDLKSIMDNEKQYIDDACK